MYVNYEKTQLAVDSIKDFYKKNKRLPKSSEKGESYLYKYLSNWRSQRKWEELDDKEIKMIESIPEFSWEGKTFGIASSLPVNDRVKLVTDFMKKWNQKPPSTTKAYQIGLKPLLDMNRRNTLPLEAQVELAKFNLITQ